MFNVFLRIYILSIKICLIDRKGNSGACIENICCSGLVLFSFFFKELIYLFLESREGKENERERNISVWLPLMHPLLETGPATQAHALTGNQTTTLWFSGPHLIH